MPNLKLYVDGDRHRELSPRLAALLPEARALLCEALNVTDAACQLAVIPVQGLPDQPGLNAELAILPRPERTRDRIEALARGLREMLAIATGLDVAVRISTLDAATYVAVKS